MLQTQLFLGGYKPTLSELLINQVNNAFEPLGDFQEEEERIPWQEWLHLLFPTYASQPFAQRHIEFWEWIESIEKNERPRPFVAIWSRAGAKSTSAELACVRVGANHTRKYIWYCHKEKTIIYDPDLKERGWFGIEEHPGIIEPSYRDGYDIEVACLPMVSLKETVTSEHRYWGRRISMRQSKKMDKQDIFYGKPHWIEAQYLDWNTWIGYPIDYSMVAESEIPIPQRKHTSRCINDLNKIFLDKDFWWMVGLWWGDGSLGGSYYSQISFACSADHLDIIDRLTNCLSRWGYKSVIRPGANNIRMSYVMFCDSTIGNWLYTWKRGRCRKLPPQWIENLDAVYQRELVRGYLDADGYKDTRGYHLTSIYLEGLLSVRRMLARLEIVSTIGSVRSPSKSTFSINGEKRTYKTARAYILRIEHTGNLGVESEVRSRRNIYRPVFIQDGFIWSKIINIMDVKNQKFIPIKTKSETYLTSYGLSHNCCGTQEQADKHVETIASMLMSPAMTIRHPALANRMLTKYGHSRGWRRQRLRTSAGFTIDSIGLDVATRGAKVEEQRPDMIVFDDIDDKHDTMHTVQKKLETITTNILPAGSPDLAVLFIQNLIHPNSIATQLTKDEPPFITDRILSGPHPAVENLVVEAQKDEDGLLKYKIISGEATWAGQSIEMCQQQIITWGLTSFLQEAQHEVTEAPGGIYNHIEFAHCLLEECPDFVNGCVWVDPAITSKDSSDCQGLQVDAISEKGILYRLFSWEQIASPEKALRMAILKAFEYGFSTVGVETDQGGDVWRPAYQKVCDQLILDTIYPRITKNTRFPEFQQAKAGAGHGSKVERSMRMLVDYEHGKVVHVIGTHDILEKALRRFPNTPLDLADAAYWGWWWLTAGQGWSIGMGS